VRPHGAGRQGHGGVCSKAGSYVSRSWRRFVQAFGNCAASITAPHKLAGFGPHCLVLVFLYVPKGSRALDASAAPTVNTGAADTVTSRPTPWPHRPPPSPCQR
jgi:hypothetical protein